MIHCANPSAQFSSYQDEIEAAVLNVLRGNRYILGDEVEALEVEFAEFIGAKFAHGVANGTDALEIAIRALGIGVGDEIITVSHTAVATVAAIEAAGATPVLVDVSSDYYTLNPKQLQEVLTERTRAIIAVHLYGQGADINEIQKFCKENQLFLIEDVSQAHGAKWNGAYLGGFGDIACYSCYPTKNLGAIGDAGLLTTNDELLSKRIGMLREYGWQERYVSEIVGRNSRLDEIQAAILRIKLRYLEKDNSKRRIIGKNYSEKLNQKYCQVPAVHNNNEHIYHLYVLRTKWRSGLIEYLRAQGIQAGIHYPIPIHLQPAYKNRIRTASNMSVTEAISREVVSLPIYPELNNSDVDRVIDAVNSYFETINENP